ncbi:sensor histidine kinase [Patulibacter defluvii]|uniref:sensor histidine kinase n=1 Tax=Patulibacter defluvii TaxID=3095358 RepID=UPI002A758EDE|nr:ATP-binding protein [Patulibacter sp. DM4]
MTLRRLTVVGALVLALIGPGDPLPTVAVGVLALAWLAVGDRWRGAERDVTPLRLLLVGADMALVLAFAALSGQDASPVLWLLIALPMIGGVVVDPLSIIVAGALTAVVRVAFGGDDPALLGFLVAEAWSVAIGIAIATGTGGLRRRFDRLDAMQRALAGQRMDDATRHLVGERLRSEVALRLADVRRLVVAGALPRATAGVPDVSQRLRTLMAELRSMPDDDESLDAALAALVARELPAALVEVEVDERVPTELSQTLLSFVRDAIVTAAAVAPGVHRTTIAVRATEDGVAIELRVGPIGPIDLGEPRWIALRGRADARGGRLQLTRDVREAVLRVAVTLPTVTAVAPTRAWVSLGVRFRETIPSLQVVWGGAAATVLALGLVHSADHGYWWVALPFAVVLAAEALAGRQLRRARWYAAVVGVNSLFCLGLFFVEPGMQLALVPVLQLLALACGLVLRPVYVLAVNGPSLALAATATDQLPQPEISALIVWVTLVTIVLIAIRERIADVYQQAIEARHRGVVAIVRREQEERDRIAADLHDDALQLLLVVGHELAEDEPERALELLDLADTALVRAVGAIEVDEGAAAVGGGLRAMIERVLERPGPPVDLALGPGTDGVHDALVVQVVREAYANAAKHARARRVDVRVERRGPRLTIEVRDDGVGVDPRAAANAPDRGHVGLVIMRERVAQAGGELLMRPASEGGTVTRAELPVAVDGDPGQE